MSFVALAIGCAAAGPFAARTSPDSESIRIQLAAGSDSGGFGVAADAVSTNVPAIAATARARASARLSEVPEFVLR
jgi:hypothetical protein